MLLLLVPALWLLILFILLGSPGEHDIKSGDSPCKKGSSDCSVKGASDKHTSQEDEKVIQPESFCIFLNVFGFFHMYISNWKLDLDLVT